MKLQWLLLIYAFSQPWRLGSSIRSSSPLQTRIPQIFEAIHSIRQRCHRIPTDNVVMIVTVKDPISPCNVRAFPMLNTFSSYILLQIKRFWGKRKRRWKRSHNFESLYELIQFSSGPLTLPRSSLWILRGEAKPRHSKSNGRPKLLI